VAIACHASSQANATSRRIVCRWPPDSAFACSASASARSFAQPALVAAGQHLLVADQELRHVLPWRAGEVPGRDIEQAELQARIGQRTFRQAQRPRAHAR
jgi:hypothetical protein